MIELKIDMEDARRVIEKLNQLHPLKKDAIAQKAMVDAARFVQNVLVWNVSGIILKRRTGNLARSIQFKVDNSGKEMQALIGSGALQGRRMIYADILETGGVITPKKVQWLTIPLRAALTPAGVPKGRARDFHDTFFTWRGGNLYLAQKTGKNREKLLFILKKRVKIPAFRYMSITAETCLNRVADIMVNRIDKELNQ